MAIQNNFPSSRPSLLLDFANSKKLDPRITFTRASTGTYYDGSTKAKAEENLLEQSQTLNNAYWTKTRGSITGFATAPNGTETAAIFTENSENGTHYLLRAFTFAQNTSYALSVFAKAKERSIITLGVFSNATTGAYFDLTGATATLFSADNGATPSNATITDVGGGWYRCSVVVAIGTTLPSYLIFSMQATTPASLITGYAGDSTSGIYFWGAQLEQRSSVTAYTPTTTAPITNYIPVLQTAQANVPRFDHNPVTRESLGLLVEESRTNLVTYSEDFGNAAWAKNNATITTNTIVAPDGTLTGDKIQETSANGGHYVYRQSNITVTNATAYTWSVYAKRGERSWMSIDAYSNVSANCWFDLANGVVGTVAAGTTATMTAVGNGWYLCRVTRTTATTSASFTILTATADNSTSHQGVVGNGIFVWGAQLEAGAFPTSYIKTEASTVTRQADAASMTGTNFSSWYRADEGTLYSEFNRRFADTATSGQFVMISDGSASNFIFMQYTANTNTGAFEITTNGTSQAAITSAAMTIGAYHKMSSAYKVNDIASSVNGATAGTDTSALIPVVNQMGIGYRGYATVGFLNGTIKKIAYYPKRLTNQELVAITG